MPEQDTKRQTVKADLQRQMKHTRRVINTNKEVALPHWDKLKVRG